MAWCKGELMARSLDDDASSRLSYADEQVRANERAEIEKVRRLVREGERTLSRMRNVARVQRATLVIATAAFLVGVCWTTLAWGGPGGAAFKADVICGAIVVLSVPLFLMGRSRRGTPLTRAEAEEALERKRQALRFLSALSYPSLRERRSLYREDLAGIIEQYQTDSRKFRRTHNTLQNLIMIGSTATTTIAALDSGNKLTWQNITIVAIGFAVTLSAAFTGYYKYRERSYFLLQTADAIEEEANAFALGVGRYRDFGPDQEDEALATFTQQVENLRNEQRRRQQQLDQPAEHTPSGAQQTA
jgi:Protein of unknown function (DUF4231)